MVSFYRYFSNFFSILLTLFIRYQKMNIAIIAPKIKLELWINEFGKYSKDINLHIWPDIKDKSSIDCICLWKHPEGILKSFVNLRKSSKNDFSRLKKPTNIVR